MDVFRSAAVYLHVLHHASEGRVHGAWMSAELARHGYRISPGTLYPTLHRMEAEGLLVSAYEVVDGRRRRTYRTTPEGEKALAQGRRAVRELAGEIFESGPAAGPDRADDSSPAAASTEADDS